MHPGPCGELAAPSRVGLLPGLACRSALNICMRRVTRNWSGAAQLVRTGLLSAHPYDASACHMTLPPLLVLSHMLGVGMHLQSVCWLFGAFAFFQL